MFGFSLTDIAKQALIIHDDLPHRFVYRPGENATVDDFEIVSFLQTWGDTSCGLGMDGDLSGQMITTARTWVFIPVRCTQMAFVYFDGEFAYDAPMSDIFIEDVKAKSMAAKKDKNKYFTNLCMALGG